MFATLAILVLSACAGTSGSLLPTLKQSWPSVQRVIEAGPGYSDEMKLAVRAVGDALVAEDIRALADAPMAQLFDMARQGIDKRLGEGKIDTVTALSYYELLRIFEMKLDQLVQSGMQ